MKAFSWRTISRVGGAVMVLGATFSYGCAAGRGGGGNGWGRPPRGGAVLALEEQRAIFGEASADPQVRAAGLVARLTLPEKVAQLQNEAPAIPRLGIPSYDWWSESLHGVARNGTATVFPQAIALAATFDEELMQRVARAIAEEARAKFDASGDVAVDRERYGGLTFFAPNLNIFRDPRWGRGQETYGEDPFLTARMGVAYVRGLQGDDPRRLLVAAVAKHFAVHSGPERTRHGFDARADAHDLADTYLPQFEAVVREAKVAGIMAAYNRVNGVPCVASRVLLDEVLRQQWDFGGFVVSDCGAVQDLVNGHRVVADGVQAAALALRSGTDLECGHEYRHLTAAVENGLLTTRQIDTAATRLFTVRFRLGLFDAGAPPALSATPRQVVGSPAHLALAREAAQKSLVLLENRGALPIASAVRRIAVVGPVADDLNVLLGNYHGDPVAPVTLLAGIQGAATRRGIAVDYAAGVSLAGRSLAGMMQAVAMAKDADLIVATLGLSPRLEGEADDPDAANADGDRQDLALPGAQAALLAALLRTGRPIVVVLTGGSAVALPPLSPSPAAVLMAWYPGEQGGHAVADVLFGDIAPSGRLPITFYRSIQDLPPFGDYRMSGRTYRYFAGKPLYPFGHGLHYGAVTYKDVAIVAGVDAAPAMPASMGSQQAPAAADGTTVGRAAVQIQATLENRSERATEEVVQVYATARPRRAGDPVRALVAFRRVTLQAHQQQTIQFAVPRSRFSRIEARGTREPPGGVWDVSVGDATITFDLG